MTDTPMGVEIYVSGYENLTVQNKTRSIDYMDMGER